MSHGELGGGGVAVPMSVTKITLWNMKMGTEMGIDIGGRALLL